MAKKDYTNWDRKELIKEIEQLRKRKKYGLVWEDKPEDVVEQCKVELPVLEEVTDKEIILNANDPVNLLIEGDNYHSLSVLNYTHKGRIDAIYIDPPYNTGAKDWKYNNDFVDSEDPYRHTKWLSFMSHRLKIAKNLLSRNGIIVCAIDHYELFTLGLLMDEIFGESNRIGVVTVVNKADGRSDDKFFATANEFMIFYANNANYSSINNLDLSADDLKKKYPKVDEKGRYVEKPLMSQGVDSLRKDRPTLFYPIYYFEKTNTISLSREDGYTEILPIDVSGIERRWSSGPSKIQEHIVNGNIIVKKGKNGNFFLYRKKREEAGVKPKTFWIDPKYNSATYGTKLVDSIVGKTRVFNYPKSLYAVKDALQVITRKDSIVLDFFAGSGTTGHAVIELNKQDGGNRKFILCTNNESSIAEDVTYPRIKNVIHENQSNLKLNLKYYKTSFVPADPTDKNKTILTSKISEMLCIKEDTFESVKNTPDYKIYRNNKKYMGIIFNHDSIEDFKKEIKEFDKKINIYIFSLGDDTFDEEFKDVIGIAKILPIPEAVLRVYRRIFK